MLANKIPYENPLRDFIYTEGYFRDIQTGLHSQTHPKASCLVRWDDCEFMLTIGTSTGWIFSPSDQSKPREISVLSYQTRETPNEYSNANFELLYSNHEKLTRVKNILGLTILDLAQILKVSRRTVYDWMDTEEISLRGTNQNRLDQLYEISEQWQTEGLGPLGSYLYKSTEKGKPSLFVLLKREKLTLKKISSCLSGIAQIIKAKRERDEKHKALLKKHGFEPISKEDKNDRLNDIDFLG